MLNTQYRDGIAIPLMVAVTTTITEGEMVAVNSAGEAVPATDADAQTLMGRAEQSVGPELPAHNNMMVVTRNRQFLLANDAINPLTAADIGTVVVLAGKNTVAKPVDGGQEPALGVGVLMGVDYSGKVWVDVSGAPIGIVANSAGSAL